LPAKRNWPRRRQRCDLGRSCPVLRPPTFHGALLLMFYSRITPALNLGGRRNVDGGPDNASCVAASLRPMLFGASLPRTFLRASLPAEGSLASRHVLRRHCDLAWSSPALRPLMLFSALRPTEGGITSALARP